ncbi:hypothetical protein B7494_g6281 [Chlorociboria aeruginascens]|nr:hypothetical protein B7494_g6281 [Chlorociboria aeruginascens]
MDYRRNSLLLNRQQQSTTNPHIYASFAGSGPNFSTDGILLDTPTMWWDEEKIADTVTRAFILAQLRPDEQERLDQPLEFGGGLTDDTYFEWIEEKAKKIFLILVDLGVPDQIFGVIDDSWDDDDLPVPLDQVERLKLTYERDEKLEKKFFLRQFNYLLRHIQKGNQIYYDDEEVVPLELADKRPVGAVTNLVHNNNTKVHLPGRPDDVFIRRKVPLVSETKHGRMTLEDFLSSVEGMRAVEHDHLISLWASYVHQENGYLLLTPVSDSNLKSFLTVTPQSIKILTKQDRRILVLNWLHCLADALSFLHGKGLSHRNIKPSNVLLDIDNHIFLGDYGIFPGSNSEKKNFDKESYDYSAPEVQPRGPTPNPVLNPNSHSTTRASTIRRSTGPTNGARSSIHSTLGSSNESDSIYTTSTSSQSSASAPNINRNSVQIFDPQKADIFSLGTIFLEILTFLLKRASRNFSSHRSSKNKLPGRGGGLPDSSFHKNLGQVESWIAILGKDASKKEDKVFRGINPMLSLIQLMISVNPNERPSAATVEEKLYTILKENCGLGASKEGSGRIHCETRGLENGEQWDFSFDEMRLASQKAAAEACASVAAEAKGQVYNVGVNGGIIYGVERPTIDGRKGSGSGSGYGSGSGRDADHMSIATKRSDKSNKSSDGKSKGSGSAHAGGKPKPKAKAWRAPVYAGLFPSLYPYFNDPLYKLTYYSRVQPRLVSPSLLHSKWFEKLA